MSNDAITKFLARRDANSLVYKKLIEELLSAGLKYSYADETLVSILDFIESSGFITPKQMHAVDNIKSKPYESSGKGRRSYKRKY